MNHVGVLKLAAGRLSCIIRLLAAPRDGKVLRSATEESIQSSTWQIHNAEAGKCNLDLFSQVNRSEK